MIVPSGIATDDTTKFFFQDLMQTKSLASLYDFENREGLFPSVDSRMKFALVTMTGHQAIASEAEFVFFALNVDDLKDSNRRFTLSAEDIALLNPNTGTTATFRSKRDAEITKDIYRHVPVLIREEPIENPWGISFLRMFDMSNDSHLFRTRADLTSADFTLQGNQFVHGDERYLPLYEAKMMHQFTHRWTTYAEGNEVTYFKLMTHPDSSVIPRYWISENEVQQRIGNIQYFVGFRDIARSTDERTAIFSLVPRVGSGNTLILVFSEESAALQSCFVSSINSFSVDYAARQKVSGTHLTYNFVKQFPVIPPHTYTQPLLDFIVPRVLELTYTAWDLQPFAQDVGYNGAPFIWDDQRRFLMRCELDALYFHIYQINRADVDYIMDTFPIVKRKDEAVHGSYRTKDTILAMYDQMTTLPTLQVPAPKDESTTYPVPDVGQWTTWLTPPPADPSVAHPPKADS